MRLGLHLTGRNYDAGNFAFRPAILAATLLSVAGASAQDPFTYESDKLAGKGLVIVSGRRSIMAAAFAFEPNDRRAAIDQFLQSFKLAR
jgi:hypothetical protein